MASSRSRPPGLDYAKMVESALRSVVRDALDFARGGLPGEHHFYITFRTHHPGVAIADHLRQSYPADMTIVLQHQFSGLDVTEDWFEVTLSFNRVPERLHIPFAAVTSFTDPSVEFGLQFQVQETAQPASVPGAGKAAPKGKGDEEAKPAASPSEGARVVALDAFRKK